MAIVHTLRVLPEDNCAENFVQTPVGDWNEKDKWFFDWQKVAQTGSIKRNFEQFYKDNKDADACFLISLDLINPVKNPADIAVFRNGNLELVDFVPPPQIFSDGLLLEENGWDNYKFTLNFEANDFVNQIEAKYWATSEDQTIDNAVSQFASVDGSSGEGAIHLRGLFPGTTYNVVFYLWSDAGKGPRSEDESEFTTLPTSMPADVQVKQKQPSP